MKLKDNTEINQVVMRVKELFNQNINNQHELSKLIDKYLIPQELEKKQNAEVSTPYKLRQEMLDSIDKYAPELWKGKLTINKQTKKIKLKLPKIFEPCCGKGGFLIDIIERLMKGLKNNIPNDEERYKRIVQECLYWSDINPTNIYICKLLLDPYGKYDLKYNEGDTLKLDIKEKWNVKGFDAVIGNPPYSTNPSKPDAKPIY